eukprot:TRINITY_DN12202_c0_g1_i1.p1 TRINITY_DN12202_c0_g1~~TRINITY_DN12202_c0_g1_i1.p1  ORF type:complete len:215 (+),score=36.23 TRINITY_DN12202_c0_g1_i1:48-647(+)
MSSARQLLGEVRLRYARRQYPEMLQGFQQLVKLNHPPPRHIVRLALDAASFMQPSVVKNYVRWAEETLRTRPPPTGRRGLSRPSNVVLDAECYGYLLWSHATLGETEAVQAVYADMKTAEMPIVGRAAAAILSSMHQAGEKPEAIFATYEELRDRSAVFTDEAWDIVGEQLEHVDAARAKVALQHMKDSGAHFLWALYS